MDIGKPAEGTTHHGLQDMKEMIRSELKEHAYQNKERKRRAENVIIHGLSEKLSDDRAQIEKIFKAVSVELIPMSFKRCL